MRRILFLGVFFFSSRRRHTRCSRDWSSDVCSSDLNFLTQPFFTAEAYTGKKGEYVPIARTLEGCERILAGDLDDRSEDALYLIGALEPFQRPSASTDRKSTRLNSSHGYISYAVFCLKKKKKSANTK